MPDRKTTKRKDLILICLWSLLLFGFTVYAVLDTFVIERSFAMVEEVPSGKTGSESVPSLDGSFAGVTARPPSPDSPPPKTARVPPEATAAPSTTSPVISTEDSYRDEHISIRIRELRAYDATVYAADVILSSPEYLRTALANNVYGRNVKAKTSSIARDADAILAVNGDYYGARTAGYVIRNGIIYRSKASKNAEDLVIYKDGSFGIIHESEIGAQALLDSGAWNVLSFGPALLIDGEITAAVTKKGARATASNPRTAVGIVDDLHYIFVVSDGRTRASEGLSLAELAQVLQELGATTAYNLDGGGSSTMVFQGRVVNHPTSNGKRIAERSVSDIVCIVS